MATTVWRKGILNTVLATANNVGKVDATGGLPKLAYISSTTLGHSGTPYTVVNKPTEIFPPITYGTVAAIKKTVSVAEVQQITVIGAEDETIVLSTRYKLEGGVQNERQEGAAKPLSPFAYTSPAVLSGTAQINTDNVFTVMVTKLNARTNKTWTAYLMYKVVFSVGTSTGNVRTLPVVGTTATSAAASQTVKIAACVASSPFVSGASGAGTMYVYAPTGTLTTASQVWTCTEADCLFTTAAIPTIQGIVILDNAGYYPSYPSTRKGITSWRIDGGFTTKTVKVPGATVSGVSIYGRAGAYAIGKGANLLADVGIFNIDKTDVVAGSAEMVLNDVPSAAKTYTRYDIFVNTAPPSNRVADMTGGGQIQYTLWADESNSGYITALDAGLLSVTGCAALS